MGRDIRTFTDEEMVAAFSLVMTRDEAVEEAAAFNAPLDDVLTGPPPRSDPRSYSEDLLDTLSLVSDGCAAKVWTIMKIGPDEGRARRERFRRTIGLSQ